MKIIKIVGIALTFGALTLLTGCELLSSIFGPHERETQEITVDKNGEVYYVQYNTSHPRLSDGNIYYLPAITSDKYAGIKSAEARSVVEDDIKTAEKIMTDSKGLALYNDTTAIRKYESNLQKEIAKNPSRAATGKKSVSIVEDKFNKGDTKKFWVFVRKNNSDVLEQKSAVCKYVGQYCCVWFIDNDKTGHGKSFTDEDFKKLGDVFDTVYPIEIKIVGENTYTQCAQNIRAPHDKVHLLLHDIYEDGSDEQQVGTMGYAYSGDLYTDSSFTNGGHSNELDVLYIDSHFYGYDGEKSTWNPNGLDSRGQIYSTIAHEYNHFINYVQKSIENDLSIGAMETWYTEMLSTVVEDLLMDTIGIDPEDSARGRLLLFDMYYNYGFELWGPEDGNVLFSYANAFAYGAFLARNFGGEELIHEIATNNKLNADSVTAALQEMKTRGIISTNETYQSTLKKFVNVLFNTDEVGIDSDVLTLNKPGKTTSSGASLTPINIIFPDQVKYSDGTIEALEPQFIRNGKYGLYNTSLGENNNKLYPGAFVVNYVGKDLSSFTIYKPDSSYSDYLEFETIIK